MRQKHWCRGSQEACPQVEEPSVRTGGERKELCSGGSAVGTVVGAGCFHNG